MPLNTSTSTREDAMFKRTLTTAISVGVTIFLCNPAYAEDKHYFGGNLAFLDYSEQGIDAEASVTAIFGRLGMRFNENFSGEFRAGFGLEEDTVNVFGWDADVELDSFFGVYVRGSIPAGESFSPYVVLGYTRGEGTVSNPFLGSDSESESDISFGFGADVNVGEITTLNIEYINYIDKDGAEINGFSIGLARSY